MFHGEFGGFVEDRVGHVSDCVIQGMVVVVVLLAEQLLEGSGIARVVGDSFGYGAFAFGFLGTCRNNGSDWGVIAACFVTGSGGTGGRRGVDIDVCDLPGVE